MLLRLVLWGLIISAVFMLGSIRVQPLMRDFALSEVENKLFTMMNKVIHDQLNRDGLTYNDFVIFEKDEMNRITAVKTNMQKLNTLKTSVTERMIEGMEKYDITTVKIPYGNLTGFDFLSGTGPHIPVKIVSINSLFAEFKNSFESAGVNQTRHQIMMEFDIELAMMYTGSNTITIHSEVCIAETIIVGETPQYYVDKALGD